MRHKLIIDGNAVYEVDDECMACQETDREEPFEAAQRPGQMPDRRQSPERRGKKGAALRPGGGRFL